MRVVDRAWTVEQCPPFGQLEVPGGVDKSRGDTEKTGTSSYEYIPAWYDTQVSGVEIEAPMPNANEDVTLYHNNSTVSLDTLTRLLFRARHAV